MKTCRRCKRQHNDPFSQCDYCRAQGREKRRRWRVRYPGREKELYKETNRVSYCRKWRSTHKGSCRNSYLKHNYGITLEEFQQMVEKQDGRCKICGQKPSSRQVKGQMKPGLCVDHHHESGRLRGLLCHRCNVMIGAAEENVKIFEQAIKYVLSEPYQPYGLARRGARIKKKVATATVVDVGPVVEVTENTEEKKIAAEVAQLKMF